MRLGMKTVHKMLVAIVVLCAATAALAEDLEVMHWWTSGGEAAAVAEFAKAFNTTGHNWVDAAIVGGEQARAVMVSRITGGDPMGAFQFNHGRQAEELIEAGLLRDITDIAEAEGWKDVVNPSNLLDACTLDLALEDPAPGRFRLAGHLAAGSVVLHGPQAPPPVPGTADFDLAWPGSFGGLNLRW